MIRLAKRLRKLKKTPFENSSSWVHCPSRRSCWHLHAMVLTKVTPPLKLASTG